MKPQLQALANHVRQCKEPPRPGQADNFSPLLGELKLDILNIPAEDRDVVEEFCVVYLQAVSDVKEGRTQ